MRCLAETMQGAPLTGAEEEVACTACERGRQGLLSRIFFHSMQDVVLVWLLVGTKETGPAQFCRWSHGGCRCLSTVEQYSATNNDLQHQQERKSALIARTHSLTPTSTMSSVTRALLLSPTGPDVDN